MRKLTIGLLIFMAGWGLSRLTGNDPQDHPLQPVPTVTVISSPSIPEQTTTSSNSTAVADTDNIPGLLQRNEFESAVERYENLQFQLDETGAADARDKILSHARQLIAQSRYSHAEQLLQRFLVAAFRDVEARILLAEVYIGEQNFKVAIDQLYEARGHAYRPLMLQRISGRIRSIVADRASALRANDNQNALLDLYQHLTQLEPDHAPWFIELATVQLTLDDKQSARRSLLLVSQDPETGTQARAMLAELNIALTVRPDSAPRPATTEAAGIPLLRKGNHFIVNARPSANRNLRLLIDTGASLTMLSPEVFEQGDIQFKDTGRTGVFNTANGTVRAPIYKLASLTVGNWQINQLEVGVLTLHGNSTFDGLLGMNFLQHFQFFIDQNEDLLRLSKN